MHNNSGFVCCLLQAEQPLCASAYAWQSSTALRRRRAIFALRMQRGVLRSLHRNLNSFSTVCLRHAKVEADADRAK